MKNFFTLLLIFFLLIFLNISLHAQYNPAAPDTSFVLGTFNGPLRALQVQPDGKIVAGGDFTYYKTTSANSISRLNADGSLDNTFNIGTGANDIVYSLALQSDGKILAGGRFTTFNGVSKDYLVRLNADGTMDTSFNIGTGANNIVYSLVLQPDGKILAGGRFTTFNGISTNRLVRLNADGSVDNTFNIGTGANNTVISIVLLPDGKILAGGYFTTFNGVSKNHLVCLNADGSVDNTFNIGSGATSWVTSLALQPDGKILAGGDFTTFNGVSKNRLVRLNANGSVDISFNIGTGADATIESLALQPDGKILAGGWFTTFNGFSKNRLVRLNADGSVDPFNIGIGANNTIFSLNLQPDGKILAGGAFTTFNYISYTYIVRLEGDPIYYNTIKGNIYTDSNNDCNIQVTEKAIPSLVVKALPGPYYGGSDAYGKYQVRVDSGSVNYTVTQEYNSINSKLLINQCATSHNVSLKGAAKDTASFDFADSVKQCSILNVTIQKTRARRCFRNYTYVNYFNYGNSPASGAQIKIEYPSDFIPLSSVPMWSSQQGSVLIYNIGTLPGGTSGKIIITDSVSCIAGITGLTECIKASISPVSNCTLVNPAWDKSSMKVTGSCQSGNAHFVITNDGTGDMGSSLQYRVYENDTLIYSGTYQLKSGENFTVDYPANGQTIRLEADQHPLHPGKSHPRATIENCGVASPAVRNLVTTAPQDDLDEETATTCLAIRDSYDPNLKQAQPSGTGVAHNVTPGQEIEYVIHFQNKGTDTAYTVTVVDTLDAGLDVSSFTQGASSHPYTLGISGKGQAVLSFRFDQINLPDSTQNEPASSGLVSFRMTVPSSASTGTVIKNKAYIYFDYNTPVITNETMHTVDNTVPQALSKGSAVQVGAVTTGLTGKRSPLAVKIYPNPTSGMVTLEMPESVNTSEMRVYSLIGVLQKSVMLNKSTTQQVNLEDIQEGLYIYEILQNEERKAGGMLKIK